MLTKNFIVFVSFFISVGAYAQPSERHISQKEYIEKWANEAVNQMHQFEVPASITLAQGILESASGNSALAKYGKNHFGIKCHDWTGKTFYLDDDRPNECFRKYDNPKQSFEDHSKFLKYRSRYSFLFDFRLTDYKAWARGLRKAGYATNPKYPQLLIQLIEKHQLNKYDKMTLVAVKKHTKREKPSTVQIARETHTIKVHANRIDYIIAQKGDTFFGIAKEFDMGIWQIYKYNDLAKDDILKIGDTIYLKPKRGKGREKIHVAKKGESMWSISQKHGIRLKKLYKKNKMTRGTQPVVGQRIYLKKQKRD